MPHAGRCPSAAHVVQVPWMAPSASTTGAPVCASVRWLQRGQAVFLGD